MLKLTLVALLCAAVALPTAHASFRGPNQYFTSHAAKIDADDYFLVRFQIWLFSPVTRASFEIDGVEIGWQPVKNTTAQPIDVYVCNERSGDNPGNATYDGGSCKCYEDAVARKDWTKKCGFLYKATNTESKDLFTVLNKTAFEDGIRHHQGWLDGTTYALILDNTPYGDAYANATANTIYEIVMFYKPSLIEFYLAVVFAGVASMLLCVVCCQAFTIRRLKRASDPLSVGASYSRVGNNQYGSTNFGGDGASRFR